MAFRHRIGALVVAGSLATAACGTTPEERGITGAGLAAAGGAVIGALTGVTILEGALVGAAVGGLAGALTDADDFNFGEPIWNRGKSPRQQAKAAPAPASKTASVPASQDGSGELVSGIQAGLAELGYDPGPVDGMAGPKTVAAISRYQHDHALLVDGQPSRALLQHIDRQTTEEA